MTSYLQSAQDFVYRRRRPLLFVGGLAGGIYMAANYAVSKLSDMQRRMVEERRDRENIRRRFQQNQEDCTYTILALLPTLGDQVFAYTDVEGLTSKLQKGRLTSNGSLGNTSTDASKIDSVEVGQHANDFTAIGSEKMPSEEAVYHPASSTNVMEEAWSKAGANGSNSKDVTGLSGSGLRQVNGGEVSDIEGDEKDGVRLSPEDVRRPAPTKQMSGLDAVSEPAPLPISSDAKLSPSPAPPPIAEGSKPVIVENSPIEGRENHADSFDAHTSTEVGKSEAQVESHNDAAADPVQAAFDAEGEKRAKLALWNELKIAAFSRTITTLYGIVLLSMQTHVQLNLLGRYAYLTSVSGLSQAEATNNDASTSKHQIRIERHDRNGDYDDDLASLDDRWNTFEDDEKMRNRSQEISRESDVVRDGIDVQTERLYLTLSWWFLHRGWRSLADLVQDAVHDVLDGVALKTPLSHSQLCAMLRKVRRRIEYEGVRDESGQYGQSSFASFDARSELSEATTVATNRRRGRRRNFSAILFPPAGEELQTLYEANALGPAWSRSKVQGSSLDALSSSLSGLLDETRDIVESDDFWRIMKLGLRSVFFVLENSLRPSFGLGPAVLMNGQDEDQSEKTTSASIVELPADGFLDSEFGKNIRLASLFPAIARQSTAAIHGVPNEYVEALSNVKELRAFCAVIYSAWS